MDPIPPAPRATVLDAAGRRLSPTERERALALVAAGRADLVAEDPLTCVALGTAGYLEQLHDPNAKR